MRIILDQLADKRDGTRGVSSAPQDSRFGRRRQLILVNTLGGYQWLGRLEQRTDSGLGVVCWTVRGMMGCSRNEFDNHVLVTSVPLRLSVARRLVQLHV